MAYNTIILFIFFYVEILKSGLFEVLYIKNTQFLADETDILNTTAYRNFDRTVTSSSVCAVLCSAYACDTFYYDVTTGNCRNVIFLTNSSRIPHPPSGMENFITGKLVCKPEWIQYGKYCIFFSKTKATWNDAKSKCEETGSTLISLHSTDMHDFIVRRNVGHSLWIGGRKTDVWRWLDNSAEIDLQSTNWSPGNPGGSGKCVQMWQGMNYKWDDYFCSAYIYFICQSMINV